MHNSVNFFRFGDHYYDVFIEDDHYLYAEAEPWNWAYLMTCKPYKKIDNGEWLLYDYVGADTEYLNGLERAPEPIARWIIGNEIRHEIQCHADNDPENDWGWQDELESIEDMSNEEIFEMLEYC